MFSNATDEGMSCEPGLDAIHNRDPFIIGPFNTWINHNVAVRFQKIVPNYSASASYVQNCTGQATKNPGVKAVIIDEALDGSFRTDSQLPIPNFHLPLPCFPAALMIILQ